MTATPSRSCRSASTRIGCDAVTPCPNAEALDRDRAGPAGCVDGGSKRGGREGSVRRRRLAWLRNAQVAQELVNVGYRADRAVPRTLRLDDGVRFLYPPCSDVAACLCAVRNGVTPACQGLDELTSLDGSQFVGLRGPVGGASVCSRSANPDSRRAAQCGPAPSNGSPPAVNRLLLVAQCLRGPAGCAALAATCQGGVLLVTGRWCCSRKPGECSVSPFVRISAVPSASSAVPLALSSDSGRLRRPQPMSPMTQTQKSRPTHSPRCESRGPTRSLAGRGRCVRRLRVACFDSHCQVYHAPVRLLSHGSPH